MRSQPEPWKCYLTHFPSESADSGKCYYTTAKKRQVCVSDTRNKLLATVWQPPQRRVKFQNQWTTYWHMPYFGRQQTYLFLMNPQGFGYQTFLDWRACPCHTAHGPGECDCRRLGLWVYRSLCLCSGKRPRAGPLHLTVHQQATGKLLCTYSEGHDGQWTSFMQTIQRIAPNLLSPGAGQAGSLFQSEHGVALKRFLFPFS